MSYRPKLRINAGENSVLFLNEKGADCALVFIHGFGGTAGGTWSGFETIAAELGRWDTLFYGYPSLAGQANSHAEFFRIFLNSLIHRPARIYSELEGRQYRHVLVVAHSLGSIVTRRALLNSTLVDQAEPIVDKVSFVLFAPAHLGATDIEKAYGKVLDSTPGLFFPKVVATVAGSLAEVSVAKSLRDMRTGSITLNKLQAETMKKLEDWKEGSVPRHLIARRVIFGSGEDIVDANRFCSDPVAEFIDLSTVEGLGGLKGRWIPGADHLAICKPVGAFEYPKEVVRREVKDIEDSLKASRQAPSANKTPSFPDSSLGLKPVADLVGDTKAVDLDFRVDTSRESERIATDLVPDPEKSVEFAQTWLHRHSSDPEALDSCLRDHRKSDITDQSEIKTRQGLDIILDRISVLEIGMLAGYFSKAPKLEEQVTDILKRPQVRAYHERIYPSPLVRDYLARSSEDVVTAMDTPGPSAFLRFCLLHSAFEEKTVRTFRALLDDYRVFDANVPNGYLYWVDLIPYIENPSLYRQALSMEETGLTLSVAGFRDFLDLIADLDELSVAYASYPSFVAGVKMYFTYWLYEFEKKFKPLIDAHSPADAPESSIDVNRRQFMALLQRTMDPKVKAMMEELDREAAPAR